MFFWVLTMLAILVLAAAAIATVVVGMLGAGKDRHPQVAHHFAQVARHLNGDAKAPQVLLNLLPEGR